MLITTEEESKLSAIDSIAVPTQSNLDIDISKKSYKRAKVNTPESEESNVEASPPMTIVPLKSLADKFISHDILLSKDWNPKEAKNKLQDPLRWKLSNFGYEKNQTLALRVCTEYRIYI